MTQVPSQRFSRLKLLLLVSLQIGFGFSLCAQMEHYWIKASGSPGGAGTQASPALFNLLELNAKLNPPGSANPGDIHVHFLPGTYEIPHLSSITIGGGVARVVILQGEP